MYSSISGKWTPLPAGVSSRFLNALGGNSANPGNCERGTITVRPSSTSTIKRRRTTRARIARGPVKAAAGPGVHRSKDCPRASYHRSNILCCCSDKISRIVRRCEELKPLFQPSTIGLSHHLASAPPFPSGRAAALKGQPTRTRNESRLRREWLAHESNHSTVRRELCYQSNADRSDSFCSSSVSGSYRSAQRIGSLGEIWMLAGRADYRYWPSWFPRNTEYAEIVFGTASRFKRSSATPW